MFVFKIVEKRFCQCTLLVEAHDTRNRQARACDALLRVCHSHKLQSAMTTWTRGVSFGKQSEAAGRMLGWLRLKVVVITLRLRA